MAQGKSRERTRTETNGNRKGDSKWGRKPNQETSSDLSFGSCDPVKLQEAIAAVTGDGAALLLSRTSDGGALQVLILDDGAKWKRWPSTAEMLDDVLEEMIATVLE